MIFVTGGTGLVGSHLLVQLSNRGKSIRALRRKSSEMLLVERVFHLYGTNPETQLNALEWVEGDLLDVAALDEILQDVKEIYHCAAMVSFQPSERIKMMQTNVKGTASLVNAALRKGNISFCHVSSIASLGRDDYGGIVTENTLWKSSKLQSNYAVSKYKSEQEVWRGVAEGLDAVIVNPSVILGPGSWKSGSSELYSLVWKGLRFYTEGITGFVDVRDVASAMVELMEGRHFGQKFIVSAENLSYKQIFTWIAEAMGKRPPSIKVHPWMGEVAWRLLAVLGLFQRKKPAITKETARSSNRNKSFSSEKLIQQCNFRFIPIKSCISDVTQLFLADHRGRQGA
ncbi:MAG: NAD-dependent epimerase/dehydratase family protein [Bacteroidales bacterium]|nr:NAD-dependent epimerase/dehydratase family protein [Bacteroidales bacterium]